MRTGSVRKYFELPKWTCDEIAARSALYGFPEWRVVEQAIIASKPTTIEDIFVNRTDALAMNALFKGKRRKK